MDFDRVLAILGALRDEGVDYILVGGAAMNLHGLVRATEDIDLFMRIRTLWARSASWAPRSSARGARRFRTIDEAQRDPDLETARRVSRLRSRVC